MFHNQIASFVRRFFRSVRQRKQVRRTERSEPRGRDARSFELLEVRCLLTPQLISLADEATSGDDDSFDPQFSRNGRYLTFQSRADDLVITNGTDGNGFEDVFVRDLQTGETILISVTPEGASGDNHSYEPSISDDGRFVAFGSIARNLVDGIEWSGGSQVFVRDRDADEDGVFDEPGESRTILVSRDALNSSASSDRESGGFAGDGWSLRPQISGDGSTIVYASSSTNLLDPEGTPTDGLLDVDIYRSDAPFGGSQLVSVNFEGTAAAVFPGQLGSAIIPVISGDGDTIAYQSNYSNIVPNDDEGFVDIFINGNRRLSEVGGEGGNGDSQEPVISRNGQHVVFRSAASNLVDDDNNGAEDLFVADVNSGSLTLVSRSGVIGGESRSGNGASPLSGSAGNRYDISDDGRFIVFSSAATDLLDPTLNITDTNGAPDVFVLDRDADGDGVFDESAAGSTRILPVSLAADNISMGNSSPAVGGSSAVSISGDGRYIVFSSGATNLVEEETSGTSVFVRDLWAEATFLIGPTGTANVLQESADESAIMTSPLQIAFSSVADLDPDVTKSGNNLDVYRYEAPIDIFMRGVVADGFNMLEIQYEVQNAPATEAFQIGVYRSADGRFDASDTLLDAITITGTDLEEGGHSLLREIGADTDEQIILPGIIESAAATETDEDYYILFVADHLDTIDEFDVDNFNDDNVAPLENIYHVAGGPVFIHGRSGRRPNDQLTITEIDEAQTNVTLNQSTFSYDAVEVVGGYRFRGHEGDDEAQAAGEADLLLGGPGDDTLQGGPGDDFIGGGTDNDRLLGEEGFDTVADGMGDDFIDLGPDGGTIIATPGSDDIFIIDGGGVDVLDFSFADNAITLDLDSTAIQTVDDDFNTVQLSDSPQDFFGTSLNDFFLVALDPTDGERTFDGGDGTDRIDIDAGGSSVSWDGSLLLPEGASPILIINFEDINILNYAAITVDNSDDGYHDTGFFDSSPAFQQGVNGGVRFGTAGNGDTATWTFTDLPPGQLQVSTTWTNAPDRATNAPFRIVNGNDVLANVVVNQERAPGDFEADGFSWENLLQLPDFAGGNLTVELTDDTADEFVVADAVRIDSLIPQTIPGQKWHDLNGNGQRDANEPGLNGWTMEIVDSTGRVVDTVVTRNIDLNGDGQIDPITEAGRYEALVNPGEYSVREVPRDGWRQTSPAVNFASETAFRLNREFNLSGTQSDFRNWGGRDERWFWSRTKKGWFFIVPDGTVFEWDGSGRSNLTGREIGRLNSTFHDDISRLHGAANPGEVSVTVTFGQPTSDINFGNTSLGSIEGRSWNDTNGNGNIDAGESGVNGRTIRLFDEAGNEVASTVTADRDLNGDNQIDPETETGFYLFEQFGAGLFTLEEDVPTDWTASFPNREIAQRARDLDQQSNLRQTRSDFRNWGGLDERWILGDDGWYYVTPNGEVFRWNGSPRTALTGTLVATLNSDFWLNLERLAEAPVPGRHAANVRSGQLTLNFGSLVLTGSRNQVLSLQ